MKDPVDHVIRPLLPWRSPTEPAITECGYDASKVQSITREQFFARLKDYGRQRTAMVTCMTCAQTAGSHPTWAEDPRLALRREIIWEAPEWYRDRVFDRHGRGQRLRDELLAIADLIAAHPEEFATIQQRRAWNERKAATVAKRPPAKERAPGEKPL